MAGKVKRPRFSRNQLKILDILDKHEELTVRDIADILWARDIHCHEPEYGSTARSLRALHERGLVEKVGGRIKWRKARKR